MMANTIDMQDMRYLNLFGQITGVSTRFCFKYNEGIVFCIPKPLISKAVGPGGRNVRRLSEIIRRKVKIIASPRGIEDAKVFLDSIVNPISFKDMQVTNDEIIINAGGTQTKASLMGRNKKRLLEMQSIVKNYFGRELRIL